MKSAASSSPCDSFNITSQADADAINSECPTVTGTIAFSPSATGHIRLDGVEVVHGDLVSWPSPTGPAPNTSITSLSSSTLSFIGGQLSMLRAVNLTDVSFPNLTGVGSFFDFEGLPQLHAINVPLLAEVGAFAIINAPTLSQMNLTSLQAVRYTDTVVNGLTLHYTGLSDVSGLENIVPNMSKVSFADNPNVQILKLRSPFIEKLLVTGDGDLRVYIGVKDRTARYTENPIPTIAELEVSGCRGFGHGLTPETSPLARPISLPTGICRPLT